MRRAHHARRAIDRVAEVVVVALRVHARVQSAANAQREVAGSACVCQLELQCHRCLHTLEWIAENGQYAVSGRLHDSSAVGQYARAAEFIVPDQRRTHALRLALPVPGAAFDVGEQVGGDCRWFVHAVGTSSPGTWIGMCTVLGRSGKGQ